MADSRVDESIAKGPVVTVIPHAKNGMDYKSIGMMSDDEIASASIGALDPLRGMIRKDTDLQPSTIIPHSGQFDPVRRQSFAMTGIADPTFSPANAGFSIGDKVYHRVRKMEGVVKDISAAGKIQVDFDSGRGWVRQENLVKL